MDMSDLSFEEAVARLLQTKPDELREATAADILQREAKVRKRIKATRQEIEDGARPRKGRFRL